MQQVTCEPRDHEFVFGPLHSSWQAMYGFYDHHLWSYLVPEGQGRKKVIKKAEWNVTPNRNRAARRKWESGAGGERQKAWKQKSLFKCMSVCLCTPCVSIHVYCVCLYKGACTVFVNGGVLGSPNLRCNYRDRKWDLSGLDSLSESPFLR